jgi:hypothetical protein
MYAVVVGEDWLQCWSVFARPLEVSGIYEICSILLTVLFEGLY